jgi:hypothetical protein
MKNYENKKVKENIHIKENIKNNQNQVHINLL